MSMHALLLVAFVHMLVAEASTAHAVELPEVCAAAPTSDCILAAVLAMNAHNGENARLPIDAFVDAADGLARDGEARQARLLADTSDRISAGVPLDDRTFLRLAETWHAVGDDAAAKRDLARSLDAYGQRPLSHYADVAADQAAWGQSADAEATLKRMRANLAGAGEGALVETEVRAWCQGHQFERALTLALKAPEASRDAALGHLLVGCGADDGSERAMAAARHFRDRWVAAIDYSQIASNARSNRDVAARALGAAVDAFVESHPSISQRLSPIDPLIQAAQIWLSLDDPEGALRVIDARARRPDLFPPDSPPVADYVTRADALARLGRTDDALRIASAAVDAFESKRPGDIDKLRNNIGRQLLGSRPGAQVDLANPGFRAYEAVIEAMVVKGDAGRLLAIADNLPAPLRGPAFQAAVARAYFAAGRWDQGLEILKRLPPDRTLRAAAMSLARGGRDSEAREIAHLSTADLDPAEHAVAEAESFFRIAEVQAKAGRVDAARASLRDAAALVRNAPGASHRDSVARYLAMLDDIDTAFDTVHNDISRERFVMFQAGFGHGREALNAALGFRNDDAIIRALLAVAQGLAHFETHHETDGSQTSWPSSKALFWIW
jgi:tetratricopeptide (TPR) repeat protein